MSIQAQDDRRHSIRQGNSDTVIVSITSDCQDEIMWLEEIATPIYGNDYTDENNRATIRRIYVDQSIFWNEKNKLYINLDSTLCGHTYFVIKGNYTRDSQQKIYYKIVCQEVDTIDVEVNGSIGNEVFDNPEVKEAEDSTEVEEKSFAQLLLFIWLSIITILTIVLIYFNIRIWLQQKHIIGENSKRLNNKINSHQLPAEILSLPDSIEEIRRSMIRRDDIIRIVRDELSLQNPIVQPQISAPTYSPTYPEHPKEEIQLLNTDQVDFNLVSGYLILRPNDKPFFSVHQEGNEFYYTLVDGIKESLASMLSGTEQFIELLNNPIGSAYEIEIVKVGKLNRESETEFRVVSKLEIRFI